MEDMDDKVHEECGVIGFYNNDNFNVASTLFLGLYALQHRGQESAGIAVNSNGKINYHKDKGLASQVFDKFVLNNLHGNFGIGHVKYGNLKNGGKENAGPIVLKYIAGEMALANNGTIVNAQKLKDELHNVGYMFQSTTDTEIIAALIARESIKNIPLEECVKNTMNTIKGSYSLLITSEDKIIAVRDPLGMRPLCLGKLENSYIVCSETTALDIVGAEFIRDINPGEIVIIDKSGVKSIQAVDSKKSALCVFEYVYIARPDSVIDGASVYRSRFEAGRILAQKCKIDADIVIGVPDSGIPTALGYAKESGIPYTYGFIKNRYVGRTFIEPTQNMRETAVAIKLNPMKDEIVGKKVIMADDSIVRGTTSIQIVKMLRKAGVKEIHMIISSPPVRHSCYFGVDTPDSSKLVANNYTEEGLRDLLGVDSLTFISLEDLVKTPIGIKCGLCTACFDGKYPIEVK